MSDIKIVSPSTGTATFTISPPSGTSTDRTFTLPDETGTVLTTESTESKFPILRLPNASNIGTQSSSSSVFTAKTIQWNTSLTDFLDTHSFWNSSTNVYTPTVAGYYYCHLAIGVGYGASVTDRILGTISRNDNFGTGAQVWDDGNNFTIITGHSTYIWYCNGSTDNIRFKFYIGDGARKISYAFATIHYLRS